MAKYNTDYISYYNNESIKHIILSSMDSCDSISERTRKIVENRVKGGTFEDIARSIGLTAERTRQLYEIGIRRCAKEIRETQEKWRKGIMSKDKAEANDRKISLIKELLQKLNDIIMADDSMLIQKISDCQISRRLKNGLYAAGCTTIADILLKSKSDFLCQRNFGKSSLKELDDFLLEKGYSLKN